MKILFFAACIIACTMVVCSSSNAQPKPCAANDSENYFISLHPICREEAEKMIKRFPKHEYTNAWARFDTADLNKVLKCNNVDNIRFVLAARQGNQGKTYPTVIMRIKLKNKVPIGGSKIYHAGSGGTKTTYFNMVQYIATPAGGYCPPPDDACALVK